MQNLNYKFYAQSNPVVQDAYDILVANLHSGISGVRPRTICITGAAAGVGKTTVAVNLAISLTLANWRVLFVDADLRKDISHKRLAEQNLLGLSDFLASNLPFESILTATNFEHLFYITCGDVTSINPIGLLCSQRFDDLLMTVRDCYDYVVIDTPSINAVADPSVIAAKCDVTYVVTEMGKTTAATLRSSLDILKRSDVSVSGVILNRSDKTEYKTFYGAYNYFKAKSKYKAKKAPKK